MTEGMQPQGTSPAETTSSPPTTPPSNPAPAAPAAPPAAAPAAPAAPAPAPLAPLTMDAFTLPSGFTVDAEASSAFLSILNNQSLSPAQLGQELLNLQANLATKSSEAGSQAWNDMQAAWQSEIANDPQIGGANLQNTIASIGSLMDRYGNDEVRAAFDSTGAGNNPHVVRFLASLAAQLKEPSSVPPGAPGAGAARSVEQRLYPNMK